MDLTESYKLHVPSPTLRRYTMTEVRNASAVLKATDPDAFDEVLSVLDRFKVYDTDILKPGGNRGPIPIRLDKSFETIGWQAIRVNTEYKLVGKVKGSGHVMYESSVANDGFEVDNMKRRVALDVEWNAKDGNLDRDLSAYRALYDVGLIDCAVIITRDHHGIQRLATAKLNSEDAARRLGTVTTTNLHKVTPRLSRGDAGGCPVWIIAITDTTWAGRGVPAP